MQQMIELNVLLFKLRKDNVVIYIRENYTSFNKCPISICDGIILYHLFALLLYLGISFFLNSSQSL